MTLDELLREDRLGVPGARKALVEALYDSLRSFFRRRRAPIEVDDLIQATLASLYRRIDSFHPEHPHAFESLVFNTARGVLHTKRRSSERERIRRVDMPNVLLAHDPDPSSQASRQEQLEFVGEALDELDSLDRRTIADWLASVDWRELVGREGVARSTLRVRLQRALARARERLRRVNPASLPETPAT